jgi:hypothetical protein
MTRPPYERLPYERLGLEEIAKLLEIHPSEVIRILVSLQAFPVSLKVERNMVETIKRAGKIEDWWSHRIEPTSRVELVRQTLAILIERSTSTRADNLFRGLPEMGGWLKKVVNLLILEGFLVTHMETLGLMVAIAENRKSEINDFIQQGTGKIAELSSDKPIICKIAY